MQRTTIVLGRLVSLFMAAASPCLAAAAPSALPVNPSSASQADPMQGMYEMEGSLLAPISNPAQTDPAEKAACLERMRKVGMPAEEHCSTIVVPLQDFSPEQQDILVRFHAYYDCADRLSQAKTDPDKIDSACALVAGATLPQIRALAFGALGDVDEKLQQQKQGSEDCKQARTDLDRRKYCKLTIADIISVHMWLHRPYALGVRQMLSDVKKPPSPGMP